MSETAAHPNPMPDFRPGPPKDNGGGNRQVRPPAERTSSERRLTTAAEGSVLPHIYGEVQTGGKIFAVGFDDNYWYLGVAWCDGGQFGISDIVEVYNGDAKIPDEDRQDYLGRPYQQTYYGNVTDSLGLHTAGFERNWLFNVIQNYDDSMVAEILNRRVGVAYSVIRVSSSSEVDQLVARVKGCLVKDYSSKGTQWLQLKNSWVDYEWDYFGRSKRYEHQDGSLFFNGLVRYGDSNTSPVLTLAPRLRPNKTLILSGYTATNGFCRMDVQTDGDLLSPGATQCSASTSWFSITSTVHTQEGGWIALELINGWQNYGGGFAEASWKKMPDGRVYIRGVVTGTDGTAAIANLPEEITPVYRHIASVVGSANHPQRLDVFETGTLGPISGLAVTTAWISLSICYYPDDNGWTDFPLQSGWVNYDSGTHEPAQYKKFPGGVVAVRGLIKDGASGYIGTLPSGYRPLTTLIRGQMQSNAEMRTDISKSGSINVVGAVPSGWMTMHFMFIEGQQLAGSFSVPQDPATAGMPLLLENSWEPYDIDYYRKPVYFDLGDGSVFVQGMVKNGVPKGVVAVLPKHLSTDYYHIHNAYTFDSSTGKDGLARIDIRSEGELLSPWGAGASGAGFDSTWASFSITHLSDNAGWTNLTLEGNWVNYGVGYVPLRYKQMADGRVYIQGLIKNPVSAEPTIAWMPPELAPSHHLVFATRCNTSNINAEPARVDIRSSGEIRFQAGRESWVSVEICYLPDADGWTDLTLRNSWLNYGNGHPNAQYKKLENGVVALRGLIQGGNNPSAAFTLPVGYRPYGALNSVQIDGADTGTRLRIGKDGKGYIAYSVDNTYLSINHMFVASSDAWNLVESDNPSNALADFIEAVPYGQGANIGSSALTTECADYNDELVYGEPRHRIGYIMERTDDVVKYADVLRDYANCFIHYKGADVFTVPDRRLSRSGDNFTFNDFAAKFDDSNILHGSLKVSKKGDRQHPTVVRVEYNDRTPSQGTDITLWKDESVVTYYGGDVELVKHWKEARLQYVGIPSRSQALRKSIEYINHLWLEDLEVQFDTFGEALNLYNGSPFLLKHHIGVGSNLDSVENYKPFRCVKVANVAPNKYRVWGREYQDDAYSDVVDITPSISDTNLPDPGRPTTVTGLNITELSSQRGNNYYTYFVVEVDIQRDPSRDPPEALQNYNYTISRQGSASEGGLIVVKEGVADYHRKFVSDPLGKDVTYVIDVEPFNLLSNRKGNKYTVTVKALGRDEPPGTPINFQGYEAGGNIRLLWSWDRSLDEFQVPLYEIRYFYDSENPPINTYWDDAQLFAKVNANFVEKAGQIAGYYRFLIKAIDVFGTYSVDPAITDVKSDSDEKYFIDNDWDYEFTWLQGDTYTYKPRRSSSVLYGHTCSPTPVGTLFSQTMDTYDAVEIYRYYPAGHTFASNRIGLGADDGNLGTLNPLVFPTPLHGEFSSLVEEWESPVPYVDNSAYTNNANFTHQVYNPDLNSGSGGLEYHSGIRTKFSTHASSILGYGQGRSFKFRVDNAKLVGYFATRREEGEITTADGTPGNEIVKYTVNLSGHYYKVYEVTLTIVGNPSSSDSIGADAVVEDIVVDPGSTQNRFDVYVTNKFTGESVARKVRWVFKGV